MDETLTNILQQNRGIGPGQKRRGKKVALTRPGQIFQFEADDAAADDILDLLVNGRDTTSGPGPSGCKKKKEEEITRGAPKIKSKSKEICVACEEGADL